MIAVRSAGDGDLPKWSVFRAAFVLSALLAAPAALPLLAIVALLSREKHSLDLFYARTPFVADLGGPTIQDEQKHFAERVERAIPIGTPVRRLQGMLTAQGFTSLPSYGGFDVHYHTEHSAFPCGLHWNVFWSARGESVPAARGVMSATCL